MIDVDTTSELRKAGGEDEEVDNSAKTLPVMQSGTFQSGNSHVEDRALSGISKQELQIRMEKEADFEVITTITEAAFANVPISRHTEQFIIVALRKAGAMTLSLVAELNGEVVGHIAASPVAFADGAEQWYGIGPLSVVPKLQRSGIGSALMKECMILLEAAGARGCALVGDPNYYIRFGYTSHPEITYEGVPQENVLVKSFCDDYPTGQVSFHPSFLAME